jgi:hypothetical protein
VVGITTDGWASHAGKDHGGNMSTTATSHLAMRNRTALVESVLGHSVDWSSLPDPSGFIAEVLGTTDRPNDPRFAADLHGRRPRYYEHARRSAASLLDLVKSHSLDCRATDPMIAWLPGTSLDAVDGGAGADQPVYRVLGWTSTSILRSTLAQRLEALHPVAAFRLLEQPEIAILDRSNRDYVALHALHGRPEEGAGPAAGAIWAHDLDFWQTTGPGDVDGVFAIDAETYRNRFAGTGVAA